MNYFIFKNLPPKHKATKKFNKNFVKFSGFVLWWHLMLVFSSAFTNDSNSFSNKYFTSKFPQDSLNSEFKTDSAVVKMVDDSTILWSEDVSLKWDDFLAEPHENEKHISYTDYKIKLNYESDFNKNFSFKVKCVFDKKYSWKKEGVTDELLQHEQGHFDIAEIHARMLRKELNKIKIFDKTLKKTISILMNQTLTECDKEQKLYDKETHHSRNIEKQEYWLSEIKKQLDKFKKYNYNNLKTRKEE